MIRFWRGFTLLELLVALAVFAILSTAGYSGLRHVLFTRSAIAAQSQRLAAAQLTFVWLEQDLSQAIRRSIRDEAGERQPALIGDELTADRLTLTRTGWDNLLGQRRANLQRVTYRLQDGRLWRRYWGVVDRGGLMEPRETLLLEQVQALQARFLDGDSDEWQTQWPPLMQDAATGQRRQESLPRAVEIRLTLEDWGEITRLLLLAD